MTQHDPSACHICGLHAIGIGFVADKRDKPAETRWLCRECVLLIERIKEIRRFDPYELKARAGGLDAAAPLVEEFGADLSEWTEEQVLMFCGAIWRGCADRMRELIVKDEAPW